MRELLSRSLFLISRPAGCEGHTLCRRIWLYRRHLLHMRYLFLGHLRLEGLLIASGAKIRRRGSAKSSTRSTMSEHFAWRLPPRNNTTAHTQRRSIEPNARQFNGSSGVSRDGQMTLLFGQHYMSQVIVLDTLEQSLESVRTG